MNRILPLNKRMIVMSSSLGKSYAGNPKAIYEEMLVKGYDKSYQIIWFYEKNRYQIPGNHTQIKYGRFRYLYYMARAQYWIFDARQPEFIKKRHGVAYLQTWHGTPLKKLGLDIEQVHMAGEDDVERYKQGVRDNAGTWDYLVSQNPYSTQIFRQAFDFQGEFLEIGYPRNDLLFSNNESNIQELKVRFGLPLDKKIILYAPTWRDDEGIGLGAYRLDRKSVV